MTSIGLGLLLLVLVVALALAAALIGIRHRPQPDVPENPLRAEYDPSQIQPASERAWRYWPEERSVVTPDLYGWAGAPGPTEGSWIISERNANKDTINAAGAIHIHQKDQETILYSPKPTEGGLFGYALHPVKGGVLVSEPLAGRVWCLRSNHQLDLVWDDPSHRMVGLSFQKLPGDEVSWRGLHQGNVMAEVCHWDGSSLQSL